MISKAWSILLGKMETRVIKAINHDSFAVSNRRCLICP